MNTISFLENKLFEILLKRKKLSIHEYQKFEKFGVHLLPVHYHSPIPHAAVLNQNKAAWNKERSFTGINLNPEGQMELLHELTAYSQECGQLPSFEEVTSRGLGPGYGEVEAHILHAMTRFLKPGKVIEIGGGVSTFFMINALSQNSREDSFKPRLTCVEPYPNDKLYSLLNNDTVEINIRKDLAENIEPDFFADLGRNDILFIDSSHAVKVNGDVAFLYLEILPKLHPGVWIHIHDIPFPYPCIPQSHPLFNLFLLWRETDILQALLINNDAFRIELCESYLHYKYPDKLKSAFDIYNPQKHFPSSLWLQKIK